MSPRVKGFGFAPHVFGGNRYAGPQDYPLELTATIAVFPHFPRCFVGVIQDDHVIDGAEVEVPQHVTTGERGDEGIFGRPPGGISAESGI